MSSGLSRSPHRQHVDAAADRRQRVAQLVRQHRQELVLAPVGLAQPRRASRSRSRSPPAAPGPPPRPDRRRRSDGPIRGDEGHHAECALLDAQRHAHVGARGQLVDDPPPLVVGHRVGDRRLGDLGHPLGHSGPEHPGNAVGSVRIGRIALVEHLGQLHLGRIDVSDREPLDRPLVAQHVDRAPVGESGNGELCHLLQSRAVVDQRRQRLARFGEEAQRRFGAATLGHVERDRDHRPRLAFGAADRRQGDAHPDTVALVAAVAQVERLAVGSAGEQRLDRGAGARAIVGVHEVEIARSRPASRAPWPPPGRGRGWRRAACRRARSGRFRPRPA